MNYQITQWCAHFISEHVKEGDLCIDATMGNGNDTLLLSRLCGEKGHVLAFDIQEIALANTRERLEKENAPHNYELFLDSHVNMGKYAEPVSVSCIVFNFGYLPKGDHTLARIQYSGTYRIPVPFEKGRDPDAVYLQRRRFRV